jgi:hypothetical protein
LKKAEQYLKPGITSERLRKEAEEKSPNEAAREMQKAKKEFLKIGSQFFLRYTLIVSLIDDEFRDIYGLEKTSG